MPSPLRNRFVHLTFEVDHQDWCEWAVRQGIRPEVISFIRFQPQKLNVFHRDAYAFPTPRSWEFVSDIMKEAPDPSVEHELIAGTIGDGVATEFTAYLQMFRELPSIDAILLSPTTEPVPEEPSAQVAVASALAHYATDVNFDRICEYLERMPTECQVMAVRDAMLREPKVKHTAGFNKMNIRNHHVLAA